ncbi:MAG: hypothetical protein ACRYF5_06425 [Janthinobacterium lividum]
MNVTISLNITNDDGTAFCKNDLVYENMTKAGVVMVERQMVGLMDNLVKVGEADVAATAQAV